jgi:hypothetical protein
MFPSLAQYNMKTGFSRVVSRMDIRFAVKQCCKLLGAIIGERVRSKP